MPQPRKPTNVLELKGAFKHNPARGRARANEPKPLGEIGGPPESLSEEEAACWHEIVGLAHAGTLCSSDRLVIEHGARLLAYLRGKAWRVDPTWLIRWEAFLAKLGMTPADRSRVQVGKKPQDANPLDKFKRPAA